MNNTTTPSVLIIDDQPQEQQSAAAALRLSGLNVQVRPPHELTSEDLRIADVIAIDQYYDWAVVPHPSEVAFWPQDGLALAAVVSRRLANLDSHAAIVLRTGQLGELARDLPKAARIPLLSAQSSIDWVLEKGDDHTATRIHQIAAAAAALRPFTEAEPSWDEGASWLGLSTGAAWEEDALAEVQVCRPPEHVVAKYTAGTAWFRWFAHRVLPFPSFLISDLKAAALLGMDISQFNALLARPDSALGHQLAAFAYNGHLSGLVGRRWWRAGIESLVDGLLSEAPVELDVPEALAEAYTRLQGSNVTVLQYDRPVVAIDADYEEVGIVDAHDCLRLAPDFWPVFADEPWALIEDLQEDTELAGMVARGDRRRLNSLGVTS
ncbi:hypothetical protein [Streptomyces albogriseolus]|uniref:hypothetical protein n=1 Tax=Streptomyces albogriseolus TaxID=1887 RepID=UPI0036CCE55E